MNQFKRILGIRAIIYLVLLLAGFFAYFLTTFFSIDFQIVIEFFILLFFLPFLFKYPEITFGLFLMAGCFKADPRLQSILPDFFDLTVFFGAIVVASILYRAFYYKKIPRITMNFLVPYFALSFLMFLSLLYTNAPVYGGDKFLRFITITTLATFGPIFLFQDQKKLHRFFYTLIIVSTLMVMDSIVVSFGSPGFHPAFGSNYLALGKIAGVSSLLILFYFLINAKHKRAKSGWLILLLLNVFGLFYAGGRMPAVAFIIVLLLSGIFSLISLLIKSSSNKSRVFKISFSTALAFLLGFSFFHELFSTFIARMALLAQGGGSSLLTRLDLYNSSIKAFSENPILGLGIGGFSVYHFGVDLRLYPHNILLEIGSELGILGVIFFVFLIGFCFFHLLYLRKRCKETRKYFIVTVVLLLFIFMFLNTLISGDINDNRLFFVWIGVAYSLKKILKCTKSLEGDLLKEDDR